MTIKITFYFNISSWAVAMEIVYLKWISRLIWLENKLNFNGFLSNKMFATQLYDATQAVCN